MKLTTKQIQTIRDCWLAGYSWLEVRQALPFEVQHLGAKAWLDLVAQEFKV